jgi:hypothetical protein
MPPAADAYTNHVIALVEADIVGDKVDVICVIVTATILADRSPIAKAGPRRGIARE